VHKKYIEIIFSKVRVRHKDKTFLYIINYLSQIMLQVMLQQFQFKIISIFFFYSFFSTLMEFDASFFSITLPIFGLET